MKLLEYQAHKLFRRFGIPAAKGFAISSIDELSSILPTLTYPVVVKAQVQTGNRGKAGGVAVARSQEELVKKAADILGMKIKNLPVKKVFLTDYVEKVAEFYLSFTIDRKSKFPIMIFSSAGGMEINEIAEEDPSKIIRTLIEPLKGVQAHMIQYIFDKTGIDAKYFDQLYDIIAKLYTTFMESDCLLAEINPLVIDKNDMLMALDAKVEIDDSALFRHEELKALRDELTDHPLVREARKWDFLYIPIAQEGNMAIISNGSGMIMSSLDLLTKKGVKVKCALDLGGGATAERVKEAIRIVFETPGIELVFINVFGGITRCDEIANGIKIALEKNPTYKIVVRMEGTNNALGIQIIESLPYDVELVPHLLAGADKIYDKVKEKVAL